MSDSESGAESGLLNEEEFETTSTCSKILFCGMLKQGLTLEPEEAVLTTTTCFSSTSKRMPYGELGSVEHTTAFGCCHTFTSNLNPTGDGGQPLPIAPGCGCESELVEEIVSQLKARMKGRGDTGNIRRAEESLKLTKMLSAKVDAIMRHMQIPTPSIAESGVAATTFEHQDYDVTSCCHRFCCCGSQILNLDPEELNLRTTTPCSTSNARRPYGELGSVDETKCCCFSSVASGMGAQCPGWGCSHELVQEIVQEMKVRMKARGDTGNIQRQEETLLLVRHQEKKIDAILAKLGVPPSQLVMGQ